MKQISRSELICSRCNQPIVKLSEGINGEPIDWNIPWEQYLCDECFDKIWDNLFDECCTQCRNHPCERGGDCWINPFPQIMYLCYVAPRVHPTPPKLPLTITNNVLHKNQETLDIWIDEYVGI